MIKPVVGIAVWKRQLATSLGEAAVLQAIADEYVQAVLRAGAVPVLLPTLTVDEVPALLDLIDGLILSGGGDVDPKVYGSVNVGVSVDVSDEADAFELALIRHAEARDLPVLGICRGCQLLNVAFGGTLHQEVTDKADGVHEPMDGLTADELLAARHRISLASSSTMAGIYGSDARVVNSLHHQGIASCRRWIHRFCVFGRWSGGGN